MNDVATPRQIAAAARMRLEIGAMAGRLAEFIEVRFSERDGHLQAAVDFCRAQLAQVATTPVGDLLAQLRLDVAHAREGGEDHALDRLARACRLSESDIDLLVLVGLTEEHEGYAALLRALHPAGEPRVTVALAAQLLHDHDDGRGRLRNMLSDSPLAALGLLTMSPNAAWGERSLALGEGVWCALHGGEEWPAACRPRRLPVVRDGLREWLAEPEVQRAARALRRGYAAVVNLASEEEDARLGRAVALAALAGHETLILDVDTAVPEAALRLWYGLCLLHGCLPLINLATPDDSSTLPEYDDYPAPILAACAWPGQLVTNLRPLIALRIEPLSPRAHAELWAALLPELNRHAAELAGRYPLEPQTCARLVIDLRVTEALEGRTLTLADISEAMRARTGVRAGSGVRLVRPKTGWESLVLPANAVTQLRMAVARIGLQVRVLDEWGFEQGRRSRRGVRLLFTGPPGTGKTLAAEVLAHALCTDLMIVDAARVVSKWLGETEKNLAAVFEAAEATRAVLFFDEADAFFGKRTEVNDAHDRYANLETAYLLQKLEGFSGVSILATNLRHNLDEAFVRRLEFVVDFPEPDSTARQVLWRVHLPSQAPLDADVDFAELGDWYPVVGGMIKNAALSSAFLAAADGGAIAQQHLIRAMKREYEKAGRAFPGTPSGMGIDDES